jgi:predicted Zn-dependent protease with MMP-like domain
MWMDYEGFADLVGVALDGLPPQIQQWLDNIEVVVEDWPTRQQLRSVDLRGGATLLGLYEGVPKTARSSSYGMVLPDKVTIFRGPILATAWTEEEVRATVQRTVVHEIAHHFGIDDDRLQELGAY